MAKQIANAISQAVKTLSQAKAEQKKPSKVVVTLSQDEQVKLAREAGAAKGMELSAREQFAKAAKALRDAKVVIGKSARTCKIAQAFLAGRFGDKAVAASSKANALSAFRAAVNDGKAYTENAPKAAVKKGAQTAPKAGKAGAADESGEGEEKSAGKTHVGADETATTYACTIARKGSAKKAAQTLRDLLNKMRAAEEYAPLCALIIDALDEFDGTAE